MQVIIWGYFMKSPLKPHSPKCTWCDQNGVPRRQFFYCQKKDQEYILSQQQPGLPLPAIFFGVMYQNHTNVRRFTVFTLTQQLSW